MTDFTLLLDFLKCMQFNEDKERAKDKMYQQKKEKKDEQGECKRRKNNKTNKNR